MLFNQYSFVILSAAAVGGLLLWAALRGFRAETLVAVAALALGCALAFLLFAPRPSTPSSTGDPEAWIGAGTPLLLEFQSPF
ncbi:MAG: hypothetical protein MUO23_00330 [Anaerolineales bacterium]|nr:hypothetical protein [Anaerolineales bacterium]